MPELHILEGLDGSEEFTPEEIAALTGLGKILNRKKESKGSDFISIQKKFPYAQTFRIQVSAGVANTIIVKELPVKNGYEYAKSVALYMNGVAPTIPVRIGLRDSNISYVERVNINSFISDTSIPIKDRNKSCPMSTRGGNKIYMDIEFIGTLADDLDFDFIINLSNSL